jgi:hypothetical protein
LICHQRRLVFVHIPKTAGSSVLETLFPELVGKWGSYRSHFLPEEYPARVWRDYFTCGFLRNPWDRMVSLYHYWCDGHYLDLPRRDLAFAEFCANYKELITYAGKPNIHARPQVDFLARKGVQIKFCGKFERLQRDFDSLCTRIGLPQTQLPRRIPGHKRKAGSYRQYYRGHPGLVEFVAREFAADVRAGGYSF